MSTERVRKDSEQTAEKATDRAKGQFDSSIVDPVRAFGSLTSNYYEELFSAQFDAVRAFADTSLAQSRSWLYVKDSDSFRQVVEEQQQAIREMSERLKADADKIRSLSQDYLRESQQLATESMQQGRNQLEENMQKGQKQVQEHLQKGQDQVQDSTHKGKEQVEDSMQESKAEGEAAQQKSQSQADRSKKLATTSEK